VEWPSVQQESIRLVIGIAESSLEQAGVSLCAGEINVDRTNYLITTDRDVPEEVVTDIRGFADSMGIAVKFQTPKTKTACV
jgi:hypothetical protein